MKNKTLKFLDDIRPENSGLKDFIKDRFQEKLKDEITKRAREQPQCNNTNYLKFLGLFLTNNFQELDELLDTHPELVITKEIKALRILNSLQLNQTLRPELIFPFQTTDSIIRKKLADNLAETLVNIFYQLKNETTVLAESKINLWDLEEIFPEIFYYLSKKILVENEAMLFTQIEQRFLRYLEQSATYNEDDSEEIKDLKLNERIKLNYLNLLLLMRQGKNKELEEALFEYHNLYKPNLGKASILVSLKLKSPYKSSNILNHWARILEESDSLQNEAEKLSFIYSNTCEYFSCSDCCSNTFPTMGLTEYLYLKNWMKENNIDEKLIRNKSELIQNDYEEKFSERFGLIDKSKIENKIRGIENPHDYKFTCPFLSEDSRCNCHAARPSLCRGFGSASNNGLSIKTCNFYLKQYQHNSSPENERYVLDLQGLETLMKASDSYQARLMGSEMTEPRGTIVAWFSQEAY